jgi:hypothetical protein
MRLTTKHLRPLAEKPHIAAELISKPFSSHTSALVSGTHYAKLISHGPTAGGMRKFVGSRQAQMTIPMKVSCIGRGVNGNHRYS